MSYFFSYKLQTEQSYIENDVHLASILSVPIGRYHLPAHNGIIAEYKISIMNLHEYQAKEVLTKFGVTVQEGVLATNEVEAVKAYEEITAKTGSSFAIVKAQIHAGGRGKGGGIKLVKNKEELRKTAGEILGMWLKTPQTPGGLTGKGKLVRKVLIAEDAYVPNFDDCREFYVSILLDRDRQQNVIIYSTEGGMDIEEVAEKTPDKVFKEHVHPMIGLQPYQARKIAFNLGLSGAAYKEMVRFITRLYTAYVQSDASLIEINPTMLNGNNQVIAVDCKMRLDDNSLYRHKDLAVMRDELEEDPTEVEARKNGLNYVKLEGNVGCMVNGAGLAMATMDLIKLYVGSPANFLDVGGTADAERVQKAFEIILRDPDVKLILVNIFGGIVRCDRVAQGIIDAYQNMGKIPVPLIVRLQGTNAKEAKILIENSGLDVLFAIELKEAAELVSKVLKEVG